ncbi:hypothetical protein IWQ62_005940 [Dispira parvispora]|uniref:Uncharacterized protein n=1 Tax=Dispira parvispora TaxID=1520584 RepID=A0A9W8AJF3_9FUNG|nr:hypothetical protein IWQ62_005940 [Dispira parvispora]
MGWSCRLHLESEICRKFPGYLPDPNFIKSLGIFPFLQGEIEVWAAIIAQRVNQSDIELGYNTKMCNPFSDAHQHSPGDYTLLSVNVEGLERPHLLHASPLFYAIKYAHPKVLHAMFKFWSETILQLCEMPTSHGLASLAAYTPGSFRKFLDTSAIPEDDDGFINEAVTFRFHLLRGVGLALPFYFYDLATNYYTLKGDYQAFKTLTTLNKDQDFALYSSAVQANSLCYGAMANTTESRQFLEDHKKDHPNLSLYLLEAMFTRHPEAFEKIKQVLGEFYKIRIFKAAMHDHAINTIRGIYNDKERRQDCIIISPPSLPMDEYSPRQIFVESRKRHSPIRG